MHVVEVRIIRGPLQVVTISLYADCRRGTGNRKAGMSSHDGRRCFPHEALNGRVGQIDPFAMLFACHLFDNLGQICNLNLQATMNTLFPIDSQTLCTSTRDVKVWQAETV
jgi:hypothetical protein